MKKTKVIIPALGILLLSTAASVTGTVAWFSMNSSVTATSMSVKAIAEAGIAIAAYKNANTTAPAEGDFKNTAAANVPSKDKMLPTFTADGTSWYHAKSTAVDNAKAVSSEGYADVTGAEDIYLLNKFQLKATGDAADVWVKGITLRAGGTNDFDHCVRVLVVAGTTKLFFAPIGSEHSGATESTVACTAGALTSPLSITFTDVNTAEAKIFTGLTTTAKDVDVYLYFDGEDAMCKSSKIYSFADTQFDIEFSSIDPDL